MEKTIRSADVLNLKAYALDKFRLAYYGTALQTQPRQDVDTRGATAVANVVRGWIEHSVESQLGQSIVNNIISNSNGVFNNKLSFLKEVLLDLGQNKNLFEFMKFLQNRQSFLREKVTQLAEYVMQSEWNNKTLLQIIIENEISKCTDVVIEYIVRLQANLYLNVDVYLQVLWWNSQQRLLCPPFNSDYLKNLPIIDLKRFSKLLMRSISSSIPELTEWFLDNT